MKWEAWVLVSLFVLAMLLNVALIGRERTPSTPGSACFGIVVVGLEVWLVLRLAGVL